MLYEQIVDRLHSMGLTKQDSQKRGRYCWPIPGTQIEVHILRTRNTLPRKWCIDLKIKRPEFLSQIRSISYPAESGFKEIQKIIMDNCDPWHKLGQRTFTTADWKDPRKISKFILHDDL
jgi:hypothetical protein